MGTLTIAKQDCYVELHHNGSLVEYAEIPAGGEIEIRKGNGYRTVVKTMAQFNDEMARNEIAEGLTDEQVEAARDRLDRHAAGEDVYGEIY